MRDSNPWAVWSGAIVLAMAMAGADGDPARAADDTAPGPPAWAVLEPADGETLLRQKCGACHERRDDGTYTRIDDARRTPEGWDMTLVRMMRDHTVDMTATERRALVRHLADTRGLSLAETQGYRYILERNPVAWDEGPSALMTEMCGRCHSYARVAVQRRSPEDWEKLLHFHLGQYPTTEYQALARDRDWWGIAQTDVLDYLATTYPLGEAPAATDADPSGVWRVVGHQPGRGGYAGTMTVTPTDDGLLDLTVDLTFADGATVSQTGRGLVYGAGEWRAALTSGDTPVRQVMALSEDGAELTGRWFETDRDVVGGTLTAARTDGAARVLSVSPSHVRQGESTRVTIAGVGLSGDADLGGGVTATVVTASPDAVVLDVSAAADATPGARAVSVGGEILADAFVVYDSVARVEVVPAVTFARVGGNAGPIPKVPAQFEAIGYMAGPDGAAGTEDDIRIGVMAAAWRTGNFDATADALEDARFAGAIAGDGLFTPAPAGPNPMRVMGTNNVGNLSVTASVTDGDRTVEGSGQLYVTVQRFIDPPIR